MPQCTSGTGVSPVNDGQDARPTATAGTARPTVLSLFAGNAFTEGIEIHIMDGVSVRVYSPEKNPADCFNYRNKIGIDTSIEALKLYRQRNPVRADELLRFARVCRVLKVMKPYLEAAAMSRQNPSYPAASVRQRLLNKARESGRPFNEILQYYAMERFLYRLSKSPYANSLVLKGALMFNVWSGPLSRPTMDIDLLGVVSTTTWGASSLR